jgi:hypothetical protein
LLVVLVRAPVLFSSGLFFLPLQDVRSDGSVGWPCTSCDFDTMEFVCSRDPFVY